MLKSTVKIGQILRNPLPPYPGWKWISFNLQLERKRRRATNPLSASEIREVYDGTAACDGHLGEGGNGAPGCGVIAIHRSRFLVADGVDEVEHHHVVHTAVAGFGSLRLVLCPELVVVLLEPCLRVVPTVGLRFALDIDVVAVVHPQAFGSLDAEAERVGTRRVRVMRYDDGLSVGAFNHRGYDVAQVEADVGQRMMLATVIDDEFVQAARLGSHCREREEAVATVNVQAVGNRAHTVRRVNVAVAVNRVIRAPLCLSVGRRTHAEFATGLIAVMLSVVELHIAKVVLVTASRVQQFTE